MRCEVEVEDERCKVKREEREEEEEKEYGIRAKGSQVRQVLANRIQALGAIR